MHACESRLKNIMVPQEKHSQKMADPMMPNKRRYEKLLAIRDFLEQTIYPKLKSRFGVSLFAEPKKET